LRLSNTKTDISFLLINALMGLVTEAEASLPSGMSITGSRLRGD